MIGHHFFSPANVMRLLEIVRGKQSSPAVIATSMDLAKRLGKVGVLVGNCRAFVGNRMFDPYVREAQFLVEEGAKIEEVDAALTAFGMAMGPLAVLDLAGLDVGWRIRKEYGTSQPPGRKAFLAEDRLCELGRFGQKTGAGWYRYEAGSRAPTPNPEAARLAEEAAREAGITPRTIAPEEIVERTVYALVNEGRTHPGRRHRPAGRRHRHRLRLRLRLPRLPRRPDVVRRHGRAEDGLRPHPRVRAAARRPVGARPRC